jgi:hemin uptake protein HemP
VNNPGKNLASHAEGEVILHSQDLFRTSRTVFIEHDGQRYLLRLTKENKLILTK